MTRLSVNINKIATLRNARGGNVPDVLLAAQRIQDFGAQGITVHPRPDERHIKYKDAVDLKKVVYTEYNIEGNPQEKFLELIQQVKPEQVTLVPDADDVLTSNAGWNTIKNAAFLKEIIAEIKKIPTRVSVFIDTDLSMIEGAKAAGADRIELYTEAYAQAFAKGSKNAANDYAKAALFAEEIGLGVNAGHDLSLENINHFIQQVPQVQEVSIGHALIAESLYLGLEKTVQEYLKRIQHHG